MRTPIDGYLQTMANRGHNPLSAIQIALVGNARRYGMSSYLFLFHANEA